MIQGKYDLQIPYNSTSKLINLLNEVNEGDINLSSVKVIPIFVEVIQEYGKISTLNTLSEDHDV